MGTLKSKFKSTNIIGSFVAEVTHVLKPNGYFVIADFREVSEKRQFESDL